MIKEEILLQLVRHAENISKGLDRVTNTEKELTEIIKRNKEEDEKKFSEEKKELEKINEEIKKINQEIKNLRKKMVNLNYKFKNIISEDQMTHIKNRIEEEPFEQLITRKEFYELIKKKIKEQINEQQPSKQQQQPLSDHHQAPW